MATLLKTDGTQEILNLPKNEKQLKVLQDAVGGYIELIHLPDGRILVVNEEGLLYNLPLNRLAAAEFGYPYVGNVVLAEKQELR